MFLFLGGLVGFGCMEMNRKSASRKKTSPIAIRDDGRAWQWVCGGMARQCDKVSAFVSVFESKRIGTAFASYQKRNRKLNSDTQI